MARRLVAALMAWRRRCICSRWWLTNRGSRWPRHPSLRAVEDKTNEHKTALRLLPDLVLKGRVITGDAIFCQRDLSQEVVDAGGHYLWFVKENQPTLLHDIQTAFTASVEADFSP